MNTALNTSSRRTSIAGYNSIIRNRNERFAFERSSHEKQIKKEYENTEMESQKVINKLCNDIQTSYTSMVKDGKNMKQFQNELNEKSKEEELFYSTVDEVYSYKDVDESVLRKMSLRRYAYYLLPVLDCFFAYFALYPIITSKLADLYISFGSLVIFLGAFLSVFVGLGVSLISRLGVVSLDSNKNYGIMWNLKIIVIVGSMLSLPLMYVIGEIAFNGGTQWTYSGSFAFVSLIIQSLIVFGYKSQIEALEYFQNKKEAERIKNIKGQDENELHQEITNIKVKIQSIISSFNQSYDTFISRFRDLAIERDTYLHKYGYEAKCYLDQMVIYFGNLICFHREMIPLSYKVNGTVVKISFYDYPYYVGNHDIFMNNDFLFLDYILQKAQSDASLSETLRIIKEQHQQRQNSHISTTNVDNIHDEPTNTSSTDENPDADIDKNIEWVIVDTNSNPSVDEQKENPQEQKHQIQTLIPDNGHICQSHIEQQAMDKTQNVSSYEEKKFTSHPWLKRICEFTRRLLEEE